MSYYSTCVTQMAIIVIFFLEYFLEMAETCRTTTTCLCVMVYNYSTGVGIYTVLKQFG